MKLISMAFPLFFAGIEAAAQSAEGRCLEVTSRAALCGPGLRDPSEKLLADRAAARNKERQFFAKTHKFVDLWITFAREYNQGTFNVKAAREVSKAFHDLEKTEGWPK